MKYILGFALFLGILSSKIAYSGVIVLGSTTSTENSGLLRYLIQKYQEVAPETEIRVTAKGTGQILEQGRRGDLDLLLVHDRTGEEAFVAGGYANRRDSVMFNDFVVVGPKAHQLDTASLDSVLTHIVHEGLPFISRGDDSGTHRAEQRQWAKAGIARDSLGPWYLEAGAGMGATLQIASNLGAFTLSDRGTWISFQDKKDLGIRFEGAPSLANVYGVMIVSKERHPHVNASEADSFVRWMLSDEGQQAIADYRINGKVLFYPIAELGASL